MIVDGQGWAEVQTCGCQTETNLECVNSIGLAGQVAFGNSLASQLPNQLDTYMCPFEVPNACVWAWGPRGN